jgi:hypothetical protein
VAGTCYRRSGVQSGIEEKETGLKTSFLTTTKIYQVTSRKYRWFINPSLPTFTQVTEAFDICNHITCVTSYLNVL